MKELYAASELLKMELPDLPKSKAAIMARAESEGWYYEERKGLGGTRRVYDVPAHYFDREEGARPRPKGSKRLQRAEAIVNEGRSAGTLEDAELVRQVVLGVGKWEAKTTTPLTPEKRAAMVALLFRYFHRSGEMTPAMLEEFLQDAL